MSECQASLLYAYIVLSILINLVVCTEGDVRLQNETYNYTNGLSTVRGRVVVCVSGSYQPICDIGWDDSDAQVVCTQYYGPNYS